MQIFHSLGRAIVAPTQLLAKAIAACLDGLNALVSRLYERFDTGFSNRTRLLRARYARRTDFAANPPPTIAGVGNRATLLTGNDQRSAA